RRLGPGRDRVLGLPRHRQDAARSRGEHDLRRGLRAAPGAGRGRGRRGGARRTSGGGPVNLTLFTSVFVTLFVIMDPVGTTPIFMSLTAGRSAASVRGGPPGRR